MSKEQNLALKAEPKEQAIEDRRRSDKASSNESLNETSEVALASKQSLIMMVDDEPIILETLQMFLEDAGYDNFITTTEPKRALNMVVLKKPDVVLLDVMMPEITGLDILAQMRSKEALKHIPTIILTSATDPETKLQALELGATDFLAKPVDPSELALRLRNTLAAKAYQDRLLYYDGLTGLPNRRLFTKRLNDALVRAKHDGKACAILHIDLDRFKQINDTLGQNFGDQLLKAVAARLMDCVRHSDLVARPGNDEDDTELSRFGGDEFTLFIPNVDRLENATLVARRILKAMQEPLRLSARELFVTTSIGIAVCPTDGDSVDTLLKHAAVAVSHAKERGRNTYQYYAKELNTRSVERLTMENDLRKALDNKELFLVFQPKTEVRTGRVIGAEALMRWKHPKLGVVPPDQFIPLAEEMDLILAFGEWALYAVCRLSKRWQTQTDPIRVSVNVSSRQFQKSDRLMLTVRNALETTGLAGKYLGLELTESMLMENPQEIARTLKTIKDMGVKVSIDDFGTGYSSFSNLRRFPLDELKIDRSFLNSVPKNADDTAIVGAMIAMAHGLGLGVVAEGVEREEQLDFLRDRGCDEYQGFLASKPLLASDFLKLVAKNRKQFGD
ncbi:MAG: EAL domain-containing protein [Gammaproteobacteria bacterium]|nr:EAL domain-containing protein [Gammaproteobacteria bacterium]NIM72807.1 EAL domain-containing protein [Gammaproteobacteria bacterium]NIN38264.1 EAL domain-containing protein [Gammaproteobacteria bacterium]NIO24555.1 EAL domain-containing protein [Gammaproteobacteria bacterium]NIO65164.1 EAL domain-containing protein [Gammaproteobacteria bacterium]